MSGDLVSGGTPRLYKVRLNGILIITVTIQGWNISDCEVTVAYDRKYLKIVQGSEVTLVPMTLAGSDVSWSFQTLKPVSSLEVQVKAIANGLVQQITVNIEVV